MSAEDETSEFAELVTALIDETFEAILDSQAEQVRHQAEIMEIAAMSEAAFARQAITDADIESGLAALLGNDTVEAFVAEVLDANTDIAANARTRGEAAIERVFGNRQAAVAMTAVLASGDRDTINGMLDHRRWRLFVRATLAREQHAAFVEAARVGIPRLIVESGRITARTKLVVTREKESMERAGGGVRTGGSPAATVDPTTLARRRSAALLPSVGRLAGFRGGRARVRLTNPAVRVPSTGIGNDSDSAVAESSKSETEAQEIEIELEMSFRTET